MKLLQTHHLALVAGGPTITLAVKEGECLGIAGPAASGKSLLLRCLVGEERPKRGSSKMEAVVSQAEPLAKKRGTPASLAKGALGSAAAAEALSACGLWDVRNSALSSLSSSQMAAAEVLPVLVSGAGVLVLDGQLERLDPWTLDTVWEVLERRMAARAAVLLATNRLELVERCDAVVVLCGHHVRYSGAVRDLPGSQAETLVVETDSQAAVLAVAGPFVVGVSEETGGVRVQSARGQETAARLLASGYGDVRAVVTRGIGVAEKVRRLIG